MRSIVLAAVVLLSLATTATAGEVRVRRIAAVAGPMVTLGEVADVGEPGLAGVVLGPKGSRRSIPSQLIRDRLIATGHYDAETHVTGASRCELTTPAVAATPTPVRSTTQTTALARERLAGEVKRRIEAAFPEAGTVRVDIAIAEAVASRVPLDEPIQLRGGHADWTLPQAMEVVTHDRGPAVRFLATITAQPMVAVAAAPLSRGQIVQASHLEWQPADERRGGLSEAALVVGRQAARSIPSGRVLQASDVRPVLLVRTGELVTARVVGDGYRVSRTMRARGSGGRGESVTLVSLDGKETIAATISDYHECTVGPVDASTRSGAN